MRAAGRKRNPNAGLDALVRALLEPVARRARQEALGVMQTCVGASLLAMRIEGHYDADADIAWVRFEGYDASTAVGEESDSGLRELDPVTGEVVGLEFWQASRRLPAEFLRMLPPPQVEVAA